MVIYIAIAVIVVITAIFMYKRKRSVEDMPQGLQVFDASGNIKLNVQDRLCKHLGTFDTGTANGRINDSRVDAGTVWIVPYYSELPDSYNIADIGWGVDMARMFPQFTQVSGGISWTFPTQTNWKVRQKCYYGIY